MKVTAKKMRKLAKACDRKTHKKNVMNAYRRILHNIRIYSRSGKYKIVYPYVQLEQNFDSYIALRLLQLKTDFKVIFYCDDEEYADDGILNYSKWAKYRDCETRFKCVIKW